MLNNFVIVGRLVKDPEVKDLDSRKGELRLAVSRSYKNSEGIYETDFINITIYGEHTKLALETLHIGDLIGTKGRIQVDGDGNLELIAEKLTFLTNKNQ